MGRPIVVSERSIGASEGQFQATERLLGSLGLREVTRGLWEGHLGLRKVTWGVREVTWWLRKVTLGIKEITWDPKKVL